MNYKDDRRFQKFIEAVPSMQLKVRYKKMRKIDSQMELKVGT